MRNLIVTLALAAAAVPVTFAVSPAVAQVESQAVREMVEKVSPSLVLVKFSFEGPDFKQEVETVGTVISEEGLVMTPLQFVSPQFPNQYLKNFQIILPARGDLAKRELDAEFYGRDERSGLAFFKAKPAEGNPTTNQAQSDGKVPVEWTPVTFSDTAVQVGEPLLSVGLLPEGAGYSPFVLVSRTSAKLRGEIPSVLVAGDGLANPGTPVFRADGSAVGLADPVDESIFLNRVEALKPATDTLSLMVPIDFFRVSLENPPTPDKPVTIPFLGAEQLRGVTDDLREFFELGNRPAVQVGDVIEESAAAQAGIQEGDVIIALNGQPLERGDQPDEQPDIFNRTIRRMNVGDQVTLTLLNGAGEQREVTATLLERPMQANAAEREYYDDLGFSVRQPVFADWYVRKLPQDSNGVIVEYLRRSGPAATAELAAGDVIRRLNQNEVTNLEQYTQALQAFRQEQPREAVVLEILRGGQTQIIRIEPPQE